jgi:hypothetical protein
LRLTPIAVLADTLVVHPVSVVLAIAVPLAIAGCAEAVIELLTVGIAVPAARAHTSNVAVPAFTAIPQLEIVQALGSTK